MKQSFLQDMKKEREQCSVCGKKRSVCPNTTTVRESTPHDSSFTEKLERGCSAT
ncbi:hypothetical protein CP8484711_2522 [Chlamydia psittaci 84-8471/1]|nr:hypothetical protein CP8484711_2522 [Chlamydia psittaci 84-8471/1]